MGERSATPGRSGRTPPPGPTRDGPAPARDDDARNRKGKEVRRGGRGATRGRRPRSSMDPFLTACGASGPLALEIEGPGLAAAERRSFPQPFVLIGRDDRADLV